MDYSSSTTEEEACLFAWRLATATVLPAVLKSAIELDILELIKNAGPGAFVSPAELAAQITTTNKEAPAMLDRILRLLAANNILNCRLRDLPHGGVDRLYSLAPVCQYLTRNDDGVSMAPMLILNYDKTLMESWYHLKDAVVEGGVPFERAYGMNAFEYPATDPRFNKVFNQAMYEQSTIFMKRILEIYKGFEGLKSLVDVGGGIGASLRMITSKYPSIQAINFDLPHVIQDAPSFPGVKHVGGDMFVSVPKADAIFIKWICHDWSDAHCQKLLKNCYEALPKNGKVIIAETTLPDDPNSWPAASPSISADVIMLVANPGGKERTKMEFQTLAKQAGFKQLIQICSAYHIWIMELHK